MDSCVLACGHGVFESSIDGRSVVSYRRQSVRRCGVEGECESRVSTQVERLQCYCRASLLLHKKVLEVVK